MRTSNGCILQASQFSTMNTTWCARWGKLTWLDLHQCDDHHNHYQRHHHHPYAYALDEHLMWSRVCVFVSGVRAQHTDQVWRINNNLPPYFDFAGWRVPLVNNPKYAHIILSTPFHLCNISSSIAVYVGTHLCWQILYKLGCTIPRLQLPKSVGFNKIVTLLTCSLCVFPTAPTETTKWQ